MLLQNTSPPFVACFQVTQEGWRKKILLRRSQHLWHEEASKGIALIRYLEAFCRGNGTRIMRSFWIPPLAISETRIWHSLSYSSSSSFLFISVVHHIIPRKNEESSWSNQSASPQSSVYPFALPYIITS